MFFGSAAAAVFIVIDLQRHNQARFYIRHHQHRTMKLSEIYQGHLILAMRGRPKLLGWTTPHSERFCQLKVLLFSDSESPWFVRGCQHRDCLVTDHMVRTCLDEAKKQRAENINLAYQHLMQLTQANAKHRYKIDRKLAVNKVESKVESNSSQEN